MQGICHPGHQHHRRHHVRFAASLILLAGCCPTSSTRRSTRGCGCHDRTASRYRRIATMTTVDTVTTAESGVDAAFASRRTLVCAGSCATGPPWCRLCCSWSCSSAAMRCPRCCRTATPIWTSTRCSSRRRSTTGSARTQLGQDLLAQTLRGMQKSMLIGVCVAFISIDDRRDRRIDGRLLRRLARPRADVDRRSAAGGAELPSDRDRHPRTKQSGNIAVDDPAAVGIQLDDQLPHRAWYDDEPAGARIRHSRKVYGRGATRRSSCATSCRTWHRS